MSSFYKDKVREIIEDFAKEIDEKKRNPAEPSVWVIDFRNERSNNIARPIYEVPTNILRFRKDNGRIASDVLSYEKIYRPISETDSEDQEILRDFLYNKDAQKTEELINSLLHGGQRDPAIITADGFLINGNRRKMSLEMLQKRHPGDPRFQVMRVVILPGKGDPGGPPTLKEIEQIENRYQLQSDGKSEYYNFDRALSIRRKIEDGLTLDEQLKDDPNFANLDARKFKQEKKRIENEFLGPLECVDRYLSYLGREGLYDTVSKGGDRQQQGRWQAFIDYHNYIHQRLSDPQKLIQMGIEEYEVGKIEDAAFKIIRKREIPTLGKVHMLIRALPNWLKNSDAKKEIMQISEIESDIPDAEKTDKDGNELDIAKIDKIWGEKYETEITKHVKVAKEYFDYSQTSETPVSLLDASLKKLNHEKMDLEAISPSDYSKAKELIINIRDTIKRIEHDFYHLSKSVKNNKDK